MGGPIDPIEGIDANRRRPEGPGPGNPTYRRILHGEVVSVRRQTAQHSEGHLLDATVGEQNHDEVLIRVTSGDLSDLNGKHVIISLEA